MPQTRRQATNLPPPDPLPPELPPSGPSRRGRAPVVTHPNPNRLQTRGTGGNARYQRAIFSIAAEKDDGTVRNGWEPPPDPTPEPQPQPRRPREVGPKPPTKITEARQRKDRTRKRQQRLARNEREDERNNISRIFDENDGAQQPSTPLSDNEDFPPQEPSLLSPSIPTHYTPRGSRHVAFAASLSTPTRHSPFTSHRARTTLDRIPPSVQTVRHRSTPHSAGRPQATVVLSPKKKQGRAKDVWFFFAKSPKSFNTFCRLCHRRKNPAGIYARSTSTGVLRGHLTKAHLGEYLEACQKYGWKATGAAKELLDLDLNDGELPRLPFTMIRFKKQLVEWIVGYDESIYVVENKLFRRLLLTLRESLHEKDIPHRSTVQRLIASVFLEHFESFKAELRVRAITTDGAANMTAMMEDYEYLLRDRDIPFDSENSHVIQEARQNATAPFTSVFEDPFQLEQQSLEEALKRDPMAIARDIINNIRMSQIRRTEFLSVIEFGNKKGKWTVETKKGKEVATLPMVIPFRDMPHRWGSGYLSLRRMKTLQQPITFYTEKRHEVFTNRLTDTEWTVLKHISQILQAPFELQEQMSREKTPMLAASLPAYESVLAAFEKAKEDPKYSYLRYALQAGINNMQANYNGQ
ncbi:hypothetical protein M422DRAFT_66368 [Sphaerobolus stellatus SS14]|nr:hypothetical protein M422DRAFT_66368 [Sphaerobolus stellatus SS14]